MFKNTSFLHTDIPIDRVTTGIKSKMDTGSCSDGCKRPDGSTGSHLLLYGLPGTGKTEFARYIARGIGKELLLKRSSDILSPWVGVNEQNIRNAFEEARTDGAILCIDEADSFFKNRRSARGSWEVSFTNELLTQMESFSGVFICSTNLVEILDPAVMRRFAWKIKFLPLKKEHRLEIVLHYFELTDLSDEERNAFTSIAHLTPGDVKAVLLKYGGTPALSPKELATELERETSFRREAGRSIGFLAGE